MKPSLCPHKKNGSDSPTPGQNGPGQCLQWLAEEPFRVFFATGILWSILGVLLWPLFYTGKLAFYPNVAHARLMIQAFGGAFVVGFLGTAGPRMATAPKLTPSELALLLLLHLSNGVCLLLGRIEAGDAFFLGLLVALLAALGIRMARFRKDAPPPQLLLALSGLLCGLAGSALFLCPVTAQSFEWTRFASLLLYHGLLLAPTLGIGSFIFPRILGGSFGEASTPAESRRKLVRAGATAAAIVAGFALQAWGWPKTGTLLCAAVSVFYLLAEVNWRRTPEQAPRGSLATGLLWALGCGLAGLILSGFLFELRIPVEHLLFIGGFGLIILVVASRVLFGHSGDLEGFSRRSWVARTILALVLLAAVTRAFADFTPTVAISHHKHAAYLWTLAALTWLIWHRRRFVRRDED